MSCYLSSLIKIIMYRSSINIFTDLLIYIYKNCLYGSVESVDEARINALINFIKWVLKYYLEVILYNCVYLNDRLSLKPWMP